MKYILSILVLFLSISLFAQPGRLLHNYPSSGSIGLQDTTYALNGLLKIPQTTAGVTLTVPTPVITGQDQDFTILNVGSTPFTLDPGGVISPGEGIKLRWSGSNWMPAGIGNTGTSRSANLVLASPDGSSGYPSFRALTSGDISGAGGITTEVDPVWTGVSGNYYTKTQSDGRYLQSFTETDPTVPSNVKAITGTNITNWNSAFSWGNHAGLYALLSGSYTNPAWIVSIPNSKITYSGSTSQYVRGDGSIASFPSIPTGTVTSIGLISSDLSVSGSPVTTSGSITANLATTGVSSGTYDGNYTVDTKGRLSNATSQTINSVTRTPGTSPSTYTISSTKRAKVYYNIRIACTASIGGNASGSVTFQYSIDGGSNWIDVQSIENSNSVSLAITLNSVTVQASTISGEVPANALCRLLSSSTGTTTITYIRGQEVY